MDPDVVFLDCTLGDNFPSSIYSDPRWQAIRAVRTRRVYAIPRFNYFIVPVDDPLLLLWMEEVLNPDQTPTQIREWIRESYDEVYRYPIDDNEIDKILFLQQNADSSSYSRFAKRETR